MCKAVFTNAIPQYVSFTVFCTYINQFYETLQYQPVNSVYLKNYVQINSKYSQTSEDSFFLIKTLEDSFFSYISSVIFQSGVTRYLLRQGYVIWSRELHIFLAIRWGFPLSRMSTNK